MKVIKNIQQLQEINKYSKNIMRTKKLRKSWKNRRSELQLILEDWAIVLNTETRRRKSTISKTWKSEINEENQGIKEIKIVEGVKS